MCGISTIFAGASMRARLLCVAVVGMVVWGGLGSSVAEASCGDYVLVNGRPAFLLHEGAAGHELGTALPWLRIRQNPADRLPPVGPCQGPYCDKRPVDDPLPTPPAPVVERQLQDAFLAACADAIRYPLLCGLSEPGDSPRDGFPPSVERPPRGL